LIFFVITKTKIAGIVSIVVTHHTGNAS
jgi:hypothetical protein